MGLSPVSTIGLKQEIRGEPSMAYRSGRDEFICEREASVGQASCRSSLEAVLYHSEQPVIGDDILQ